MKVGIVGTGYVSDMYAATLPAHPELELARAFDRNERNRSSFCTRWRINECNTLQEMLDDPAIEMALNLTDPRSHYEVTKSCLEAGKHVYSEKPLAMTAPQAVELTALAERKGVQLSSAPCSVLSETAQTMWHALRNNLIGKVRVVYANFDDGTLVPRMSPWNWANERGVFWPAKDEFEVGCTYEHAGYVLTWLAAFFGPARSITSFASILVPEKGISVEAMAPDFSVGCIEYGEGVVARVTCGLVTPRDKSLTIIGDEGILSTGNVRNDAAPVYLRQIPSPRIHGWLERHLNPLRKRMENLLPVVPWSGAEWNFRRKLGFVRKPNGAVVDRNGKPVDFLRGPSELAAAIRENRSSRLSAKLGTHITELIETLQYPERFGSRCQIKSTFDPIPPMPWSQ
jgi:predicted dehydrogenase